MNIRTLVSKNMLSEALDLLESNSNLRNEIIMQRTRLNRLTREKNMGIISNDDANKVYNQIAAAILDLADITIEQVTSTPIQGKGQVMNPLVQFNSLYKDRIHADLDGLNFNENNVRRYVQHLAEIFVNPALFNSFLQPLNDATYNDVNATMADKLGILKGILEALIKKEDAFRTRLTAQVEKQNSEVEFVELLNNFFKNPTPKGWTAVYQSVGQRFADRSLFGQGVSDAWDVWNVKLSALDQFDIAFDIADTSSQMRCDLGAFLAANLQIKNFNY